MDILIIIIALLVIALYFWMVIKILGKAGFVGWWCLILLVPIVNLIMIWVFAFIDWPRARSNS